MDPVLTVGYSCLSDRVDSLKLPDAPDDVEVIVAVQGDDPPDLPPGVRRIIVPGRGVAKSRNAVLDEAAGRYLLFCDDDVSVDIDGVMSGVAFLEHTSHALALGRAVSPDGQLRKQYSGKVTALNRFNSGKAATYEMLVAVAAVRAAGVRFDERFGAGAPLHLADEYIFISDLLAAGLTGAAIPAVFGVHPSISSGLRWDDDRDDHARAAAINRVFGSAAPLARVAFAGKQWRRLGSPGRWMRFVTDGERPP